MSFNYNAQGELVSAARVTSTGTNSSSYLYDYTTNICNHSMTQMINAVGTVYKYQYLTNSSGYITSKCTNTVISTNYYLTYLNFYTNENRTCLTYSSGSTNQVYDYYYDPDTLRYSSIIGPGSSNTYTTFSYDELYQSCTNKQVNEGSEYLRTVTAYGDGFVTNEASGYCSAPSNYWKYTWNTNLQVITSITDPESHKTEYEYTNAFISKVKLFYDASNAYETAYAYTTNGLLSVVTNANGHSVGYYYDSYGYMASAVPQDGPTISYAHNSLGILTNISLPSSDMDSNEVPILRNTSFDVNELGWVKKITYADGGYESFSFDSLGNITNKVDTGGRNTKYTYLPTKKLSSITKSLGTTNITTSFTYDNQFNTLTITDAKSRAVESYLLDIQDRPVTVTNLEGQTMSITYGLGSYVKQINRFDGTTVSNSYNSDGLLSSIKYPDATNNLLYYKNSMLKSVSSGSGIISNTYNTANRLSSVQVSGFIPQPYTVSYSYFPAGQLSNVVSTAGTNSYTLDNADRISTFNANIPGLSSALAFNWSYNTNNGLASGITSTNSGISVAYDYDYRDRVTSIIWRNASNEVLKSFGYSYNSTGMISDISYETGESVHYTYDGLDRLTGETHYSPASGIISDDGYGYDEVGNRTSKTRSGLTLSYSYPYGTNGNRLSSWSVTSTNQTAFVDIMGSANETIGTNPHFGQLWVSNETSVTPFIDGTNFWVYELPVNLGTQQVVAAIRDVAGNTTFVTNTVFLSIVTNGLYGYNSAGCITNISYSGSNYSQNISLLWNAQYQLTQISTNGDVAERNGYDALGRRAWNWDGVSTNYFVYNGQQIIADVDSAGTIKRSYIWGPGIDNLLVMNVHTGATVVTYYALKDHLGSIHAMADEAGQIVESYRYDSWGRTTAYDANGVALTESQIGNRYCWQGREYSWITGLYYFRARWYDPITGRWLSNDPIGISGGLNQYVFCGNNPVNYRDPMGLADRAITQQEFDNAMASAYDDVINGTAPKLWQEYIPLVGVLIRLAHLDMPEFRDPEGAEKDVFYLEGGDDNCSTKTKNKRLGLGEEVNYAKIGMWDNKYNPVPGSSMWVWKLLRWGQLPSSQTKEWYEIGYQYANDRGSPNIPKNGSLLNPVYIH